MVHFQPQRSFLPGYFSSAGSNGGGLAFLNCPPSWTYLALARRQSSLSRPMGLELSSRKPSAGVLGFGAAHGDRSSVQDSAKACLSWLWTWDEAATLQLCRPLAAVVLEMRLFAKDPPAPFSLKVRASHSQEMISILCSSHENIFLKERLACCKYYFLLLLLINYWLFNAPFQLAWDLPWSGSTKQSPPSLEQSLCHLDHQGGPRHYFFISP